ncbi:MAG: HAMP domain-containing protein [Alphaproteobacteria bacterium]|nr:HAMP domain-containing protein [Alphaproteobacteria bacterium]
MNDDGAAPESPVDDRPPPRDRLFRKYALMFGALVSTVLIAGGLMEMYFSYQEAKSALLRIQREKANAAAAVIEQFVKQIEAQIGWTTHAAFVPRAEDLDQRRIDFFRLLRQAPAITEITYLDAAGGEQLLVSRLVMDVMGSGKDYANDPKFRKAREQGRYFGPVYFRQESEPYLTIGLVGRGRDKGVTVAEVNLKFIWDVISQIKVGRAGYAFVVDSQGLLIAHPNISLVLRKTDLSTLPQVESACAQSGQAGAGTAGKIARGLEGREVLTAHASIVPLGWLVFVESPLSEAFAPLYDSLARTAVLLAIGIALSVLAALLLARRIVRPIGALQEGAARIGSGDLGQRIHVRTGDELERLADDFNRMTAKLQESYDNIERVSQLKRYFSPHLAELIVSSKDANLTESHRRKITVVFCDLRNFTAFSSTGEPEDVTRVLQEYYEVLGAELRRFEATIDHFAGDGLMAFFNDPLPCPDPAARAVRMALAMQQNVEELIVAWRKRGIRLGFGVGISSGYATLGHIGSEEQFHYTAIGSVANLASRLCDEARNGQILIDEAVHSEVEDLVDVEQIGEVSLKGFPKPVPVLQVIGIRRESRDLPD